jgi:hypothetical protein
MQQQTPNIIIPTPPNTSMPSSGSGAIKPIKPKLTNAESILLILFVVLALVLYSTGTNTSTINQIQKFLIWIWVIVAIAVLYRNYSLFGGELPQEENTKLTTAEKILIWVFGIISPSIVGLVVLFTWYKKNPAKVRRANIILTAIFLIEILLGFLIAFLQSKGA